ncbi:unnamed protein product [Paramecium pentaurelia]|uniref:Uncharacterized protein n=1 Tax=Paramecium pentaurelia TaxID=43138 RepID=A0A8S1VK10_9CILI|nr:unnamed protein product [Paramecium pentaurelia]
MGQILEQCCKKGEKNQMKSSVALSNQSLDEPIEITEELIQKLKQQLDDVKKKLGDFEVQNTFNITQNDVWPIKLLGRGSFGKVYLVKIKDKLYAMKQIKKKLILKKQQLENLLYERFILQKYDHPFIIKMYFVYQEPLFINMVMEFVQGGELFYHLNKRKKFDQKTTAFFASQIVLALEFLHETVGVAYRDLKPENVLLCKDGYIKLADMGLAKDNSELNYSFCGTAEYLAPEMIEEKGHNSSVDFWTLGCIIFEMLFGHPPFQDENKKNLYIKIQTGEFKFPPNASQSAQSLIKGLLQYHPEERLNFTQIKQHEFFEEIDFDLIYKKKLKPPFEPLLTTEKDTRNFDYVLESQLKQSEIPNIPLAQELFQDFPFLAKQQLQF